MSMELSYDAHGRTRQKARTRSALVDEAAALGITPELRSKAIDLLRQVGMGDRLNHRPH